MVYKPQAIVGSSVHPFAAWAAAIISKRYNVPFIFEVRDLWPKTLIELGFINRDKYSSFGFDHISNFGNYPDPLTIFLFLLLKPPVLLIIYFQCLMKD